eukprot:766541-Hanusia_phi.AAC.5
MEGEGNSGGEKGLDERWGEKRIEEELGTSFLCRKEGDLHSLEVDVFPPSAQRAYEAFTQNKEGTVKNFEGYPKYCYDPNVISSSSDEGLVSLPGLCAACEREGATGSERAGPYQSSSKFIDGGTETFVAFLDALPLCPLFAPHYPRLFCSACLSSHAGRLKLCLQYNDHIEKFKELYNDPTFVSAPQSSLISPPPDPAHLSQRRISSASLSTVSRMPKISSPNGLDPLLPREFDGGGAGSRIRSTTLNDVSAGSQVRR